MDEYIKREDAYKTVLHQLAGTSYHSAVLRAIEAVPTADVAPKSEVAREIFEEIAETCVPKTPEERGRETQIGYVMGVNAFLKNILELKQKYTKNP